MFYGKYIVPHHEKQLKLVLPSGTSELFRVVTMQTHVIWSCDHADARL